MIRRSNPKYLNSDDIDDVLGNAFSTVNDELYFNRGSSALRFLIENISTYYNKKITICMQSFNCITVLDASLEANATVLLADVKLDDFSIDIQFIKKYYNEIDALLLLHYQGTINKDYIEIIEFCKKNNIIVIEDLAHCHENAFEVKGDFGIYSYSVDKPFTSWSGGKIIYTYPDDNFIIYLHKSYIGLKEDKNELKDLKLLKFVLRYSTIDKYNKSINSTNVIQQLQSLNFADHIIYKLSTIPQLFRTLNFINNKFQSYIHDQVYLPKKMGKRKKALINLQRKNSIKDLENFKELSKNITNCLNTNYNSDITYDNSIVNRLSFICDDELKSFFQKVSIEASNYNWPTPLHLLRKSKKIIFKEHYYNTELLSAKICNFPVWTDEVLSLLSNNQKEKSNE